MFLKAGRHRGSSYRASGKKGHRYPHGGIGDGKRAAGPGASRGDFRPLYSPRLRHYSQGDCRLNTLRPYQGAYTGAVSDSKGFFRQADGGTRFADEIGELILELQAMILRAIEQEKVRPMGTNVEVPYHARLIIGAKPTLVEDVRQGKFKLDLLTRLCEAVITVPALRERPEDIGPLVEHFSRKWSERHGVEKSFLASTLPLLERFPWPGNVRELRNLVNAAARFTKGKTKVGPSDVEQTIAKGFAVVIDSPQTHGAVNSVEKMTDNYFLEVLGHSTSARDAARKMDVSHSTVARFLQRKGLNPKQIIGINRSGMGKSDRP